MTAVRLSGVSKGFEQADGSSLLVLDAVDLAVAGGEFFAVVGPSGCGKTTLLDLVMGLSTPTSGDLNVAAERPAMVFQRPHLLPWRTVLDNAIYGLECRGELTQDSRDAATELLQRMHLGAHLHEHPHRLSEGMKQRVNLARALLVDPDLLLMDEPFAALDPATRRALSEDLLALWDERKFTVLFVSHALETVVSVADRIAVLSEKPTTVVDIVSPELARPRGGSTADRLALLELAESLTERYFPSR